MYLNQMLAVMAGKKSQAEKSVTEIYQQLAKPALLDGIAKTYRPLNEDGEKLPPESKRLQLRVRDANLKVQSAWSEMFDVTLSVDEANSRAKSTLHVDGVTIGTDLPVVTLLFLEKKLTDLATYVEKLPTLDPSHDWTFDDGQDCFATPPTDTARSKKNPKVLVKYEATKEHPAQVEVVHEDQLAGYWTTRHFSGAIPAKERNEALARVRKLLEAVKIAREEANAKTQVQDWSIGENIFDFVFTGK